LTEERPSRLSFALVRLSARPRIKGRVIACGTRYDPITEEEEELVNILNSNALLLVCFEEYPLPTPQIISNELGDMSRKLRQEGFRLSRIEEFKYDDPEVALVSKMVLDETRYVYCRVPGKPRDRLESLAHEHECTVVSWEREGAVIEAPSKYHALRLAVSIPLELDGSAAVGLTQAAAVERHAKAERYVKGPFAAFSKAGGEWVLHEDGDQELPEPQGTDAGPDRVMYLDIVESSKLVEERGRPYLENLMKELMDLIADEEGVVIDHKLGGDDVLAKFPTKGRALRAAIRILDEARRRGIKIKIGIGDSGGRAAENAVAVMDRIGYSASFVAFRFGPFLAAYVEPPTISEVFFRRIPSELGRMVGASMTTASLATIHPYLGALPLLYFPTAAIKRNRDEVSAACVWGTLWLLAMVAAVLVGVHVRSKYLPKPLVTLTDVVVSQAIAFAKSRLSSLLVKGLGAGLP